MNKEEFLQELQQRLAYLPASETARFISYYREMIDDRLDEGMSEAEAVADLGDIDRIVEDVQYEMPMTSLVSSSVKQKTEQVKSRSKERSPWLTVLLILALLVTSPIWLTLLIVFAAVLLAVLVTVLAVGLAIGAGFVALVAAGVISLVCGAVNLFSWPLAGLTLLGLGLIFCGLSVIAWYLAVICIKGIWQLLKICGRWVKGLFVNKGGKK